MIRNTLFALLLGTTPVFAGDFTVGDLTLSGPHILETPPNAPVAGGYVQIANGGDADDRLVSVSVAKDVAGLVELHQMAMEDGVMKMSEIEGGIAVPAGETVMLERGGLHVMFMQLGTGLSAGDTVAATLEFETAGTVDVTFEVRARGEAAGHGSHGHGSDHGNTHSN